jgi:hypothetical protein
MNDDAAGQGPHERPVGRPVDEATDTSGPRGTYGCACLDRDSCSVRAVRRPLCVALRPMIVRVLTAHPTRTGPAQAAAGPAGKPARE